MLEEMKVNSKSHSVKAISLFAGAGGCSCGFEKYGFNIIAAFDSNQEAVDTYNQYFKKKNCRNVDLSTCDFEKIRDNLGLKKGDLDIIIGGPPCQGFTSAGKRFEDDPRNKLVLNYANAIRHFYPKWFMMENVEGILTTAKGEYLIEGLKQLIPLGYTLCLKKVYMQEFGVPQRRKRVIIIGNREGKKFDFPQPDVKATGKIYRECKTSLFDAIGDLENEDSIAIAHIRKKEAGLNLERIQMLKQGQSMKDLPVELQHSSFAKRSTRRVCDGMPSEKRGGAPSGIKRLIYKEPSLTITSCSMSEFVHPTQDRMLTIRECARIQTFPDDFSFVGTETQQMKQIGNAIPPLFANKMADSLFKSMKEENGDICPGLLYYDVTKASAKSPALASTCEKLEKLLIGQTKLALEV